MRCGKFDVKALLADAIARVEACQPAGKPLGWLAGKPPRLAGW
jgi:hypothetical protein